ncbi:MAG: hypothetical protein ACERKV_06175 [Clostridiaceae bacterium]
MKVNNKVFKWHIICSSIIIVLVLLYIFIFPLGNEVVNKKNYKDKNYIGEAQEFLDEHEENMKGDTIKSVEEFNIQQDTFSFRNFGSRASSGGNCFGFAYVEKMYFLGDIKRSQENDENIFGYDFVNINKPLGNYKMDQDEIDNIYGSLDNENLDSYDKFVKLFYDAYKPLDTNLLTLYNNVLFWEKINFEDIKDQDMRQVLLAINYYQIKQSNIKPNIFYMPKVYKSKNQIRMYRWDYLGNNILNFFKKDNTVYKFNINVKDITGKIDNNKPILMAISSGTSAHAILGYAYEYVNNDILKVYVSDSNLPLFNNESKAFYINEKINGNTFIVFKKINNEWQYKYDPYINNKYIYEHQFNSYMMGSWFEIY